MNLENERSDMMTALATTALIQPNAQHEYTVTPADLPLSCPMPGMYLWNSHPRVYLPIEASGWAKCGYCGAEYTLVRG
jgi:uncharacterized Zn-finger protein